MQELALADRLEIHELMARYGNIIDERQFSRTREVFTADARYDLSDLDDGVMVGVEAIVAMWTASTTHPLAHHVTNVEITTEPDGTVAVYSKVIGVGYKGRVGSATYHDVVHKTDDGWRIAERVVILRTPDRIPPIT